MPSAYRDTNEPPDVIISRAGSPRMTPLNVAIIGTIATVAGFVALPWMRDPFAALGVSLSALGVFGFVTVMLRRQRFVVSRIATRLEIREGDEVQSLFVREVKDVDVEGPLRRTFAVVCVLTDGRRVAVGEPRTNLEDAQGDQRRLLEALE